MLDPKQPIREADVTEKISDERTRVDEIFEAERENFQRSMHTFATEFATEQKPQDHNTGEMGAALRRYIETIEKEMPKIEIWGRDHYALKNDVDKSIAAAREDVRIMTADIKTDLRALAAKIDQRAA